jgi:MoaA/NifB/PqqE/SkfB family radical SAM enzyme
MARIADIARTLRDAPSNLLTPSYLEFSVCGACNFACSHCHQLHHLADERAHSWGEGASVIDAELANDILRQAAEMGIEHVEICGRGEPTLHPKLPEIITLLRALGLRGSLITNGSGMNDRLVDAIAACRFDRVSFSVYGSTQETFEKITHPRRATDLTQLLRWIHRVKQAAPRTRVVATVCFTSLHADELESLASLVRDLCVDEFQFTVMRPYHEKQLVSNANPGAGSLTPEAKQLAALISSDWGRALPTQLKDFLRRYVEVPQLDTIETTYSRIPCYAGRWATFVCDDGTVRPCSNSNWILGDLKRDRLRDIWFGSEYDRFRKAASGDILRTRRPLPRSYCSHCGWARMQEIFDEAVKDPESKILDGWDFL